VPGRLAQHADGALAGHQLPGRQLEQRRFARAVGAEQTGHAGRDVQGQLVQADDVAVPLGDAVEDDDGRHFSWSSDFTRKLRVHVESPINPARTAADHHHGYCGTIWSASAWASIGAPRGPPRGPPRGRGPPGGRGAPVGAAPGGCSGKIALPKVYQAVCVSSSSSPTRSRLAT